MGFFQSPLIEQQRQKSQQSLAFESMLQKHGITREELHLTLQSHAHDLELSDAIHHAFHLQRQLKPGSDTESLKAQLLEVYEQELLVFMQSLEARELEGKKQQWDLLEATSHINLLSQQMDDNIMKKLDFTSIQMNLAIAYFQRDPMFSLQYKDFQECRNRATKEFLQNFQ
eukprot:TRINITY_DN15167_c0_g1_i3.p1 TRINITY_DN15167_c0_g1~~TRINITY_DN15167_c0_g1_i3.p1  ORF type:complete len:171 (-),score=14.92 TRINITY_DN15167_c0_g1_i3:20-532(-)